jgi:hypothetical protein
MHTFRRSVRSTNVLKAGKQGLRRAEANSKRQSHVQCTWLAFTALHHVHYFLEMSTNDRDAVLESMPADANVDIDSIPYTAPHGQEGADLSYEGLAQKMTDLSGW